MTTTTVSTERVDRALAVLDSHFAEGHALGRAAVDALTALARWGAQHDVNVAALVEAGVALARAAVVELPPPVPTPAHVVEDRGIEWVPPTTGAEFRHIADRLALPDGWRVQGDLRGKANPGRVVYTPDGRRYEVIVDRYGTAGNLVSYVPHAALRAVGQFPSPAQPFVLAGIWAELIGEVD